MRHDFNSLGSLMRGHHQRNENAQSEARYKEIFMVEVHMMAWMMKMKGMM
jgi:hypothetical protein